MQALIKGLAWRVSWAPVLEKGGAEGSKEWKIMEGGGSRLEAEEGVSSEGRRGHAAPYLSPRPSLG